MNQDPTPSPDEIRAADPEKFDTLLEFFRQVRNVTGDMQQEICVTLLRDPKFQARVRKDSKKSEAAMQDIIDHGIKVMLGVMPLAMLNGVNPIMSLLSAHTTITGDPMIAAIITKLNEEVFDDDDD